MKRQNGSALIVTLSILAVLVVVGLMLFKTYVSSYDYGNTMEQQLKAVQTDNKNILAQYGQKVLEAVQVPEMYSEDLIKVTTAAIEGRYGENGSQAAFQWLQEQNPQLDASIYKQIQQIIEAGRNDFEAGQRKQIDVRRQYETKLGNFWSGFWLKIAGYPKVNLDDFDIVSTSRADTAFETKQEEVIQLRQK